jgi:hypothetical protein
MIPLPLSSNHLPKAVDKDSDERSLFLTKERLNPQEESLIALEIKDFCIENLSLWMIGSSGLEMCCEEDSISAKFFGATSLRNGMRERCLSWDETINLLCCQSTRVPAS